MNARSNRLLRREIDRQISLSIARKEGELLLESGRNRAHGHYWEKVNGVLVAVTPNLIPAQGRTLQLDVLYGAVAKPAAWYVALYANAISPADNWTAANFASTAGEITSQTEGYSGAVRKTYTPNAGASGVIDNVGQEAAFAIVCTTSLNVNGAALLTVDTRGATTGFLGSATRYGATRVLANGDTYEVGYRTTLTSS